MFLRVYKGLIRAHLEWGAVLFSGGNRNTLRVLDRVQYQALRVIMGCMRTTPIPLLLSEAGEPPLRVRRIRILKKYSIRIAACRDNPLKPRLKGLKERLTRNSRLAKYLKNFSLLDCLEPISEIMNMKEGMRRPGYYDYSWSEVMYEMSPIMDLQSGYILRHSEDPNGEFQDLIKKNYESYIGIFTDGAHTRGEMAGASSFFIPELDVRQATKLQNCFSALTAELYAIFQALKYALEIEGRSTVICTDSQAALIRIKDRMREFAQDKILHEITNEV